jgi:hypothetical protein
MKLARADRPGPVLSGKQPALAIQDALPVSLDPPAPQKGQEIGGQHRVAVATALAALDPQKRARRVDIGDLERGDLGHPQSRAIGDR